MISFNFSKKKDTKPLQDSKFRDESTKEDVDDTDFVTSVEGNEIQGTKKKVVKKELIIPLIGKNDWRVPSSVQNQQNGSLEETSKKAEEIDKKPPPPIPMSLQDQAIQELLSGNETVPEELEKIPLLLQNKVPDGYEEDDNMDVSLRPDQPTLEDYENIPIEEFGMAMLRGMGFKEAEGIGLTNKRRVEMLEPQLRPKGLGLGASASQIKNDIQNGHTKNDKEEAEVLVFKIGAGAVINKGPDKGMYGKVESFDEDNNRVILKLAISGKMAGVSKFHITLVKESDYKIKSKVLNYDQYDEYKKKQEKKEKDRRDEEADSRLRDNDSNNRDRKRGRDDDRRDDYKDSKRQNNEKSSSKSNGKSSSKSSNSQSSSSRRHWVRSHLKVRFIDKKFKNGRHYEKKFIVEDVLELDRFSLRSESGDVLLEDICSTQLETVIPKEARTLVCILFGKQKGSVGELVEKNKRNETAIIKIPDGGVYELSYDDICEFVGDPEDYC